MLFHDWLAGRLSLLAWSKELGDLHGGGLWDLGFLGLFPLARLWSLFLARLLGCLLGCIAVWFPGAATRCLGDLGPTRLHTHLLLPSSLGLNIGLGFRGNMITTEGIRV